MKGWIFILGWMGFFLWSVSVFSADIPEKVKKALPDMSIERADPIPMEGPFYEVSTSQGIFYLDGAGRYLLTGDLYDLTLRKNLTEVRRLAQSRTPFEALPLDQAVLYQKGRHKIAIFADPDCPFCQKLHPELHHLDATVYVFLFPMTDLHPQAYRKSVNIWCSDNRSAALDSAMAKIALPIRECGHPLQEVLQLGARLGIRATPTMILGDGRRIEGYRSVSELSRLLSEKPETETK